MKNIFRLVVGFGIISLWACSNSLGNQGSIEQYETLEPDNRHILSFQRSGTELLAITENGVVLTYKESEQDWQEKFSVGDNVSEHSMIGRIVGFDNRDRLWFQTQTGLSGYSNSGEEDWLHFENVPDALRTAEMTAVIDLQERGNWWVATSFAGVWVLDTEQNRWEKQVWASDTLFEGIGDLFLDSNNNIWISSTRALHKYTLSDSTYDTFVGENRLRVDDLAKIDQNTLPYTPINLIYQDTEDVIWVGSQQTLYFIEPLDTSWTAVDSDALIDRSLYSVFGASGRYLLFGGVNSLLAYDLESDVWNSLDHCLDNMTVIGIEHDSDGRLWLASRLRGLWSSDNLLNDNLNLGQC